MISYIIKQNLQYVFCYAWIFMQPTCFQFCNKASEIYDQISFIVYNYEIKNIYVSIVSAYVWVIYEQIRKFMLFLKMSLAFFQPHKFKVQQLMKISQAFSALPCDLFRPIFDKCGYFWKPFSKKKIFVLRYIFSAIL